MKLKFVTFCFISFSNLRFCADKATVRLLQYWMKVLKRLHWWFLTQHAYGMYVSMYTVSFSFCYVLFCLLFAHYCLLKPVITKTGRDYRPVPVQEANRLYWTVLQIRCKGKMMFFFGWISLRCRNPHHHISPTLTLVVYFSWLKDVSRSGNDLVTMEDVKEKWPTQEEFMRELWWDIRDMRKSKHTAMERQKNHSWNACICWKYHFLDLKRMTQTLWHRVLPAWVISSPWRIFSGGWLRS